VDRILTTHTGSLIRPPSVLALFDAAERGEPIAEHTRAKTMADAVAQIVREQANVGVDIVSDGEIGKFSWVSYLYERISGLEIRELPPGSRVMPPSRDRQAAVVDADQEPPRVRPPAIRRAIVLMWLSLALNLVILAIDWRFQVSQMPAPVLILSALFGIGISVWLFIKIATGRNWARIVYLVLFLLGLITLAPQMLGDATRAAHIAGMRMIEVGLDFATMYLVFFPGREWFKRVRV